VQSVIEQVIKTLITPKNAQFYNTLFLSITGMLISP